MEINRTKNLDVIYLAQNQTNKEILINEGFLKFDSLMNNGAKSASIPTPPTNPEEGDLYIIPNFALGDWTNEDDKFTYYHPSKGWVILEPNEGITLWVNDEDMLYTFNGASWVASLENNNSFEKLGINSSADAINKLVVKSDAILFDNNGNDSQVKINKSLNTDTASHLFQTNYSGRAEFGLTGDDDFHIKVSADGSSWKEVLVINKDNGILEFMEGTKFPSGTFTPILIGQTTTGTNLYTEQTGEFTVIGNRCFFDVELRLNGTSGALDSTGDLVITGLPFSKVSGTSVGVSFGFVSGVSLGGDNVLGYISGSAIVLKETSSSGTADFSDADATDSLRLNISGNYIIS